MKVHAIIFHNNIICSDKIKIILTTNITCEIINTNRCNNDEATGSGRSTNNRDH